MARAGLIIFLVAILLFAARGSTSATTITHSGLSVSPAIQQLSLETGQNETSFKVQVTNSSSSLVTIHALMDDFTALSTTGSVLFLNNTTHSATRHGLAHWMSVNEPSFDLQPGANKALVVRIADAASMAPGGHYGAVIFKAVPAGMTNTNNLITTNAEVSLLVFLTTYNPGTQNITLARPSLNPVALTLPDSINLVFTNTGDAQTTPRGVMTLNSRTGQEVARGIINTDSGLILPSTSRLYSVVLKPEARVIWPGVYHLNIYYRAGSDGPIHTVSISFFYLSPVLVFGAGLLLCALIIAVIRRSKKHRSPEH